MRLRVVVVHIGVNDLLIFRNGAAVFALCLQAFCRFCKPLFGVFQRLNAVELIVETDVREQLLQAVEQFIGAVVVRFAFLLYRSMTVWAYSCIWSETEASSSFESVGSTCAAAE